jgi:hypothetical protein
MPPPGIAKAAPGHASGFASASLVDKINKRRPLRGLAHQEGSASSTLGTPPLKRKPPRSECRLATSDLQRFASHGFGKPSRPIPAAWRREGDRLLRQAQCTGRLQDWRAAILHQIGIAAHSWKTMP